MPEMLQLRKPRPFRTKLRKELNTGSWGRWVFLFSVTKLKRTIFKDKFSRFKIHNLHVSNYKESDRDGYKDSAHTLKER